MEDLKICKILKILEKVLEKIGRNGKLKKIENF